MAALATPPDVVSQVILFTVIYGLYEISIQLVARLERIRLAELRANGTVAEDEDMYGNPLNPVDDDDTEPKP
jgi:sec-independent protein translocase protein TatC